MFGRICSTKKLKLDQNLFNSPNNNLQLNNSDSTSSNTYKIAHVFCSGSGSIDSINEDKNDEEPIKEGIQPMEVEIIGSPPVISLDSTVKSNLPPEQSESITISLDEYEKRFMFQGNRR